MGFPLLIIFIVIILSLVDNDAGEQMNEQIKRDECSGPQENVIDQMPLHVESFGDQGLESFCEVINPWD